MLKRIARVVLVTLVLGYLGLALMLYLYQEKLLYHPSPKMKSGYPSMFMDRGDAIIAVHILHPGKSRAVLYFGGNGESMAMSEKYIAKQFPEMTCYLMDYRGYGASSGKPSEEKIFADALALYDKVSSKHQSISVTGRSLGSGVAVYVAAHRTVDKLILVTPYDSIESVAQERYPFMPVSWLLKDPYRSVLYAPKINAPTLIIAASDDKVVPFSHTKRLIDAFVHSPPEVVMIKKSGHNDIVYHRSYTQAIERFMAQDQVENREKN